MHKEIASQWVYELEYLKQEAAKGNQKAKKVYEDAEARQKKENYRIAKEIRSL